MGDTVARRLCQFLEKIPVEIDTGITRTDFSDTHNPVRRYIGPNGEFTNKKSDGIKTDQECYQAAIQLAEMTAGKMKVSEIHNITPDGSKGNLSAHLLYLLKNAGVRIHWLPTDPVLHREPRRPLAIKIMTSYLERADKIWKETSSITDAAERRRALAKTLFEKMLLPENMGGFGINFFNPSSTSLLKKDHLFFSSKLNCFGSFLYGILCERFGIKATPVQRFTNEGGKPLNHIIVGLSLDAEAPANLTLVSFQPGEKGFGLKLNGNSIWAPISRLELLAYIHATRAFELFSNNPQAQRRELRRAYRYAPHNYFVHYALGVWYSNEGKKTQAEYHFKKSRDLSLTYRPPLQ